MRLRKTKISKNPIQNASQKITIKKAPLHSKNANKDVANKKNQEESPSIYINKILQNNLQMKRTNTDFKSFKDNISNFQSSIKNILSSEENRKKSMKYIIGLRNKSRGSSNKSPFVINQEDLRNAYESNKKNATANMLSKTINDGFYDPRQRNDFMFDKDNYKSKYNYKRKLKTDLINQPKNIVVKPFTGYNIYTNNLEPITPNKTIRVNRLSKYYDEISFPSESNIYVRNNLSTQSSGKSNSKNRNIQTNMVTYKNTTNANYPSGNKFYIKKQYNDASENPYVINSQYNNNYDDGDDNEDNIKYSGNINYNQFEPSSENENSGLKEVIVDNMNEIYQSPKYIEDYNDEIKYLDNRNNIYNQEYNINKLYSKKPDYTAVLNRYKYNTIEKYNSFTTKAGKTVPTPASPPPSSFNDLKIEKSRFRIKPKNNQISNKQKIDNNSEIMEKIRDRFLDKLKQCATNTISIKGIKIWNKRERKIDNDLEKKKIEKELSKVKNDLVASQKKNKENENQLKTLQEIIQSLKEIINTHKFELESKNKEIEELKKNTDSKELKKQINEYIAQIDNLKETNKNLQEIIDKQKEELDNKNNEISKLKENSELDLKNKTEENLNKIKNLEDIINKQKDEISTLKEIEKKNNGNDWKQI